MPESSTADPSAKSTPAYAALATRLRDRILSGELQPGERLPSDTELTAEFGVGRSTIREALRSLASQNLILTTRGVTGGSFVAVPSVGHISEHLETGVALMTTADAVTVDQLMEVRNLMEVPAAGMAAFRRTEDHLDQLRASIFDPTDAQGPETFVKNQEFHLVLLRAAQNPLLELITAPVFRVLSKRFGRDHAPEGFWQCVDHDHRAILDVVAAGDSMSAMDMMRRHLDHLGGSYRQMDKLRTQ
ncbi:MULTISPECIES: FadR/GntR family transcriptional regulator [Nocardiaceae]|uniref:DNA-binding FadR family transcriptional regulator n=1 Tax=Rhodococcoides corynebacterioides TaxID=53972 RepID=A0ABS2KWX4_9NOCA|nr:MULTISPECIES: FCD domain-containing protein [Rhodococcus]KIQ20071.1 transcriptional regulator [Rhodococcus sp. MEB064]MBM7415786.1 DNA-binding FadR family transcriptional regulator [Rhodococcus corynebacterioides]MBP1118248.1 DNA-binding FadR family transcriptional regulator [Rhodococcus sp. PvP016]MBY6676484.1 FadR family transcriptional regulator [Rhodococcus sp. BP-332]MBY6682373.1 FadR family transcriptional regulator [Rhodococcus sp. BP-316]